MNKCVKIKRALSKINSTLTTEILTDILNNIPTELIDKVRSDELAIIIDLMDKSFKAGKVHMLKKISKERTAQFSCDGCTLCDQDSGILIIR